MFTFQKSTVVRKKGENWEKKSSFFKLIRKVAADFLQIREFTFICKHSGAPKLFEKSSSREAQRGRILTKKCWVQIPAEEKSFSLGNGHGEASE